MGDFLFVFGFELHGTGRFALFKGFFVASKYVVYEFGLLVTTSLRLFLHFLDAAVNGFQVFDLEFKINDFLVPDWVDSTVYVGDVGVFKTTDNVQDGICFPDVGQEFVAQPFAFAGPFDQSGDVDNFHGSGDDTARLDQFSQFVEAFIRYGNDADVGLNGAKRKVGRLRFGVGQTVEQG